MFVYNITTKVDHSVLHEWIRWQKEVHIPEILSTGLFSDFKFFQLLEQDEEEGKTFVIQFFTDSIEKYQNYLQQFSRDLRIKSHEKWKDRIVSFRSLLQEVV